MRSAVSALLAALVLVPVALGAAATPFNPSSGVIGQVVLRQTGARGCIRAACLRPVAGVTVTFTLGQRLVRATSDKTGRFRVALAPGAWIARAPGLTTPRGGSLTVRVREGRYLRVAFLISRATGLR